MAEPINAPGNPNEPKQPPNPPGGGGSGNKQAECQAMAAQLKQLGKDLVDLQNAVNRGGPQLQQVLAQFNQVKGQFDALEARFKQMGCE